MGLLGLDEVLSIEKLERLEGMASTMDDVADRMQASAELANEAADKMLEAAKLQNAGCGCEDCSCR